MAIEESGRVLKEWYVELTEWVQTLTNILIRSADILMSYYFDLVESNITYLPHLALTSG
jgi:hypothetical protein